MELTTLLFLGFFAAVALLNYTLPRVLRPYCLLAASYLFYCWGANDRLLVPVLVAATLVTWGCGLVIGKCRIGPVRVIFLLLAVFTCVGLLFYYKYWNLLAADILSGMVLQPRTDMVTPLGLGYFTLAALSYTIDVYKRRCKVELNPLHYALFVSFFPTMTTGPIERYPHFRPQIHKSRRFSYTRCAGGAFRMLWGYFKKLVIADRAAVLVNAVIKDNCPYGGAVIASGILFYCIQLYCDFSGGIDITRGVARLFGIDMAENFRRPIFATSLTDYWRRWHITLGAWMRDYVFYPISLSRGFGKLSRWARTHIGGTAGKIFATSLATFIVYFIIGIWHGANFRYIAFGLWNGVLITASLLLEKTFLRWKAALHVNDKSAGWRVFMTLRTALLVFIGRYFTRAPRLRSVFTLLKTTVLHPQPGQLFDGTLLSLGLAKTDFLVIALGLIVLLVLESLQERGVQIRAGLEKKSGFVQWAAMTALLLAVFLLGVFRAGYIPSGFIYTQF